MTSTRLNWIRCFATLACVVLIATGLQAQVSVSKKEVKKWLQDSDSATRLHGPGEPFHLFARFQYTLDRKSRDGTYELFWSAPDQYREEFRMGEVSETDVASGHKLYVQRNSKALPLPLWRIRQNLNAPLEALVGDDPDVKKVYSDKSTNAWRTCADLQVRNAGYRNQVCFDQAARKISSIAGGIYGRLAPSDVRISDFQEFGQKLVPKRIYYSSFGEKLDLEVTVLETTKTFAESVFQTDSKFEARDWCPEATQKGRVKFPHPPGVWGAPPPPMAPRGDFSAYYLLIGPDGQVANLVSLRRGPGNFDRRIVNFLHNTKFPIRRCGEQPIAYEIIFTGSRFGPYGWY